MSARVLTLAATGVGLAGGGYMYLTRQQPTPLQKQPGGGQGQPQQQPCDPRPYKLLTPSEIDERLTSGQCVNRTNLARVQRVFTNRLPSNEPVEDNYSVNTFEDKLIAGVYDGNRISIFTAWNTQILKAYHFLGHIGPHCSCLIKTQLPIYVARQLRASRAKTPDAVQDAISSAFETLDQDIQQRFYDLFPRNVRRCTEQDIRDAVTKHPDPKYADLIIKEAITGSCACVVYLDGDDLYAANTGDSRVVSKWHKLNVYNRIFC